MRSWLTALRISRREMRRAKGRSALVIAMIALPVVALGYAAASYDMFTLTPAETVTRQLGTADASIRPILGEPVLQDADGVRWEPAALKPSEEFAWAEPMTEAVALSVAPEGSRVVPVHTSGLQVRTATEGLAYMSAYEMDLADPIYRGRAVLLDGRAPAAPGEVAMTEAARERVGDTIRTRDGSRSWTVVGTVEFPAELGQSLVFAPGTLPRDATAEPAGTAAEWLVDAPAPIDWAAVQEINKSGALVTSRAVLLDPPDPSETPIRLDDDQTFAGGRLSLAPLVIGLAMLEIVLLAGPAFAVGARRRQRSLALIAANGGTRAHLRRIVLADGLVLGLAGAAIGLVLAVPLALLARPLAEEMLVGARAGGYRFNPPMLAGIVLLAVVTGLLAAAVPAFTSARLNVVAALTGRRGVVRSKRRWLFLGLILVAAGATLATLGTIRIGPDVIMFGLVVAQIGLVLCTPSLVGLIARAGGVLPPAPRIALRDTARNRSSSAPAISAVMAAVAGTVAIGVYFASVTTQQRESYTPSLPAGYVSIGYDLGGDSYSAATPDRARAALATTFPGATMTEISEAVCPDRPDPGRCGIYPRRPPAQLCPGTDNPPTSRKEIDALLADPRCAKEHITQGYAYAPFMSVVGNRDTLVALTGASGDDLARAVAVLDRGGVVVTDPFLIDNGVVTLDVSVAAPQPSGSGETTGQTGSTGETGSTASGESTGPGETTEPDVRTMTAPGYLLETGRYATLGLVSPALARQAGLNIAASGLVVHTPATPEITTIDRLSANLAEAGLGNPFVETGPDSSYDVVLFILAAASALITLGAAGIATGLAAADGRADLTTLAAIGAAPGVRRWLSLSQSGVIAGLGSLLGVAAGIGSAFAALAAVNESRMVEWPVPTLYPLAVPWLNLMLILIVPLVAMLGAGLLTRSRLPIERRRPT
ncbi:FtsX-like permease family protein [Catenuloplanes japonicus]|uniref:FtsX-like permease family protein n=1 Tax=Catenuloplanes japonicus TaxID=33876 RepID=UPI000526BBEF|nr:FtsX-like permease family protein [Catenuloplanes japonicus]